MAIVIRRLEEHDGVENFDSGDDALNNYLKRHAWTNQEKMALGYFTPAMAIVPREANIFAGCPLTIWH